MPKEKPRLELSDELIKAQELFKEYLNENRVQSVFSKEGVIDDRKKIGKYINLIMDDAKEDFLRENMDQFMSVKEGERGKVFRVAGAVIMELLKVHI